MALHARRRDRRTTSRLAIWSCAAVVIVVLIVHRFLAAPELGDVDWRRDFDEAATDAAASGRPIALLFQEVPGCPTCVAFGDGPLSDPTLLRALHELFVPVAIFNNLPGADGRVRRRFDEPAWNNPVMRFVDADGNDLIPRREHVLSEGSLRSRMIEALEQHGASVPRWLRHPEQASTGSRDATLRSADRSSP